MTTTVFYTAMSMLSLFTVVMGVKLFQHLKSGIALVKAYPSERIYVVINSAVFIFFYFFIIYLIVTGFQNG